MTAQHSDKILTHFPSLDMHHPIHFVHPSKFFYQLGDSFKRVPTSYNSHSHSYCRQTHRQQIYSFCFSPNLSKNGLIHLISDKNIFLNVESTLQSNVRLKMRKLQISLSIYISSSDYTIQTSFSQKIIVWTIELNIFWMTGSTNNWPNRLRLIFY